jgi:hypothetical protein
MPYNRPNKISPCLHVCLAAVNFSACQFLAQLRRDGARQSQNSCVTMSRGCYYDQCRNGAFRHNAYCVEGCRHVYVYVVMRVAGAKLFARQFRTVEHE